MVDATYARPAGRVCAYAFARVGPGRPLDATRPPPCWRRGGACRLPGLISVWRTRLYPLLRQHAKLLRRSSSTRQILHPCSRSVDDTLMGVLNDVQFFRRA